MNYSKIGERLKLIRERKGLSYEQIFEITKIQPSILKGIEEGKSLVSPVFLKGFIKTYASSLGLDPEVLLQLSKSEVDKKEEMKKNSEGQKPGKTRKKYLKYLFPLIAFVFVLQVFWFIGLSNNNSQGGSGETEEGKDLDIKKQAPAGQVGDQDLPVQNSPPPEDQEVAGQEEKLLLGEKSLFREVQSSVFTKEILIKSSEVLDIYFKLDKKSTVTKSLEPSKWFHIKAKESIYLRFDIIQGDISIFYNGEKVDLVGHKGWFERSFL